MEKVVFSGIHWLASYPKSGNTWIRMLYHAYVYGYVDINSNRRLVLADTTPSYYQGACPYSIGDVDPLNLFHIKPAALAAALCNAERNPVVIKTHSVIGRVLGVELIPRAMTASCVYIVRDPRSVAVSYSNHLMTTIDEAIERMANEGNCIGDIIPSYLSSWSKHVSSWAGAGAHVVKYEDLHAKPEECFTNILKVWGVSPNADRVKAAVEMCQMENLRKQEDERGFIEAGDGKFFRQGKVDGWKDELTEEQAGKIEKDHSEQMKRFGYC